MEDTALIYMIKDLDDVVLYVGSTTNYKRRQITHKCGDKRYDLKIYKIIENLGGWDFVEFEIIFEMVHLSQRYEWEQIACDYYKPLGNSCNPKSECFHNRMRKDCVDCNGSQTCIHKKRTRNCRLCNGSGICKHIIRRNTCKVCSPITCEICFKIYSKNSINSHLKTHIK
jgi:hypothetical protein